MGLFFRKPLNGRLVRRMYKKSGLLFLPVTEFFCKKLSDTPINMLLVDTGTTASVLDEGFVSALGGKDIPQTDGGKLMTLCGIHDVKNVLWVPFTDAHGRKYREDFLVTDKCMTLQELSKETGCLVVGILGTSFMERYGIIINFKTKEITL